MYSGMEEGKYPDRRRRFNKELYLQCSFDYTVKLILWVFLGDFFLNYHLEKYLDIEASL